MKNQSIAPKSNSLSADELVRELREALDPAVVAQIDDLLAVPVLPPLPRPGEIAALVERETERRIANAQQTGVALEANDSVIGKLSEIEGERAVEAQSSATRDVCETGNLVIFAHIFRDPGLAESYRDLLDAVLDPEGALGELGAD